jgi:MIP family channel proteins
LAAAVNQKREEAVVRDFTSHFVAEFIGVFALVFVGGGAIMMSHDQPVGLVAIALAHGLILGILISATMRISGHLNPAVTLGFLATRRIDAVMAGVHIVAQLLGAMVAAYALRALIPAEVFDATRGGGQSVALSISTGQAIAIEAIATFFLTFAVFGTAVDQKGPKLGGFAIGATLSAFILAIGPLTGASLNPARSFGPAVASGTFEGLLIYFVGPIVGAVAAALIYEATFLKGDAAVSQAAS